MAQHIPYVIAHRGASGEAPENTIAAFLLAIEQSSDGFELDVHLSKDGQVVIIHDHTIDRTTNGTGNVNEMTVEELSQYDAGAKFHSKFKGEKIPTLEQLFSLIPANFLVNVEMKGGIGQGLEEAIIDLLTRTNRLDSVIISSFDYKGLAKINQLNSNVKLGLLYHLRTANHWKLPDVAGFDVYSLHPYMGWLDEDDAAGIIEHRYSLFPWTVNDDSSLRKAIAYQSTGIITDYPARARRLLNEMTGQ